MAHESMLTRYLADAGPERGAGDGGVFGKVELEPLPAGSVGDVLVVAVGGIAGVGEPQAGRVRQAHVFGSVLARLDAVQPVAVVTLHDHVELGICRIWITVIISPFHLDVHHCVEA